MNNYVLNIFYFVIIFVVLMLPVHFANLNKKKDAQMGYIRLASWLFGWTIIGWMIAMYLSVAPNPKD